MLDQKSVPSFDEDEVGDDAAHLTQREPRAPFPGARVARTDRSYQRAGVEDREAANANPGRAG